SQVTRPGRELTCCGEKRPTGPPEDKAAAPIRSARLSCCARPLYKRAMSAPSPKHPNTDVRMRGFAERTTVEDALAWLDSVLPALSDLATEKVGVSDVDEPVA